MTQRTEELKLALNSMFEKAGYRKDVLIGGNELELNFISTGSRSLDRALGGGLAVGRTTEFVGQLSTLKTFFAQKVIANAQAKGMEVAFFDVEGSFDPTRAEALGVDTESLLIIRGMRGDQGLSVVCSLLQQGNVCVVIDSVAALVTPEEDNKDLGEITVATQARLMSQAMRRITLANRDGLAIFINQLRSTIGVSFGPQTVAPGGKALGFYATHRVMFSRVETIKEERKVASKGKLENKKVEVAQLIQAKVEKSKIGRPFQTAVMKYNLEIGQLDVEEELLNLSLELGFIQQDGPQFYTYENEVGSVVRVRWQSGILKAIEDNFDLFAKRVDEVIYGG